MLKWKPVLMLGRYLSTEMCPSPGRHRYLLKMYYYQGVYTVGHVWRSGTFRRWFLTFHYGL